MNINRDNYEIYILDYYEGRLQKSKEEALFVFLDANPDLKEEFNNFENISINDETPMCFDFKESLKKTDINTTIAINLTNYKEFFIADNEGDLSNTQKKQLEIFLAQHPFLKNDYHLFQITKLSADKSIIFKEKHKLKKFIIFNTTISKKLVYQSISIAASLLIMASITTFYFNRSNTIHTNVTAISEHNTDKLKSAVNLSEKQDKTEKTIIDKTKVLATNIQKVKTIKKQILEEKMPASTLSERITEPIRLIACIPFQKLTNESANYQIEDDSRNYYTSLNTLLVLAEEQSDINIAEQINNTKKPSRFEIDDDLLKGQPIAEAGGFLKNIAVIGFSKIEEFGTTAKDTYLALEEKYRIK
ncbi:MAG: hypothetical protein ACOYO1_12370 [Bacteroidales bacterium]